MDYGIGLAQITRWAEDHGIRVDLRRLGREQVGVFNGVSIALNDMYDARELTFYFVHALGSIIIWSRDSITTQKMFDELRDAKTDKSDRARLEVAIDAYQKFEIESSELAVGLLQILKLDACVADYTSFLRADLAAMTIFHRTGEAPVWADFLAQWNSDVANGRRIVEPFQPRAIRTFKPIRIERQEILQKQP
jgi:hypothetical protein